MQTPQGCCWEDQGWVRGAVSDSTTQWTMGFPLPGEGFLPPLEGTPVKPRCIQSLLELLLPGKRAQPPLCHLASLRIPTRKASSRVGA